MTSWTPSPSVAKNAPLAATMRAMDQLAPLRLADSSWDNVGLLVEADGQPGREGVMLAIDLTTPVCDEILAAEPRVGVALVYHPLIFRGLKSITRADPQQTSILRLLAAGISVYCPHTSLDATPAGINDWLACLVSHDTLPDLSSDPATLTDGDWAPIQPSKEDVPGAGMGRLVNINPSSLDQLVARVKRNLDLSHGTYHPPPSTRLGALTPSSSTHTVQVSRASDKPISTVAVCAGSGSSVFRGVKADLRKSGGHSFFGSTSDPSHSLLCSSSYRRTVARESKLSAF